MGMAGQAEWLIEKGFIDDLSSAAKEKYLAAKLGFRGQKATRKRPAQSEHEEEGTDAATVGGEGEDETGEDDTDAASGSGAPSQRDAAALLSLQGDSSARDRMLCGTDGCTLPRYHPGLCSMPDHGKRSRRK